MSTASESLETRIDALIASLPQERKVRLLSGETSWTTYGEPAIGLRPMVMSDGPVGVRGLTWDERDWSACTPSPTAMAASWDPELVDDLAGLLAAEARRKGVDILLAPTINLHRTPVGGRHFECFSEDPTLTGVIGGAYVDGLQSRGVAATVKHYVANDSETERMTYEAVIDPRTLRELYLQPFEDIQAAASPWLVMAAYNATNGPTMTENDLLVTPLESEWGFDGVVVSDWSAVRSTVAAGRAATDLAMPGPDTQWAANRLLNAVREGVVAQTAIDEKVRRLLRLAARVGALDGVESDRPGRRRPDDGIEVAALLRRAAAAGMVLARNNGLLPLEPTRLGRVAVIGPNAAQARVQGGGSARVASPYMVSPLQGLVDALGPEVEIVHAAGAFPSPGLRPFDAAEVTDPVDGSPGLRVRLKDAAGHVWRDEHRTSGWLLWTGVAEVCDIAEVEASALFCAPTAGRYRLGFGGVGAATVTIDGSTVFDDTIRPSLDSHFAALLEPIDTAHEIDLQAGQQVLVEVRLRPDRRGVDVALLMLGVQAPRRTDDDELAYAAASAASADVAVVVVGTTEQIESEGFDRTSLALPGRQDELVSAVAAANPHTVVVVNSGGPVEMPWLEDVAATVLMWFPGQEGGNALADVLTGRQEPGGRMPTTWARRAQDCPVLSPLPVDGRLVYSEGLHIGYRGWLRSGAEPALPFGSGLGYTTWCFDTLTMLPTGDGVTARVRLTNTGSRPGAQTVQVYLSRPDSVVERPVRWLAGFARVQAGNGQSTVVDIELRRRAFAHWSADASRWLCEAGTFDVLVGDSVMSTPLRSAWELADADVLANTGR
jgi:beta-glucosidase